MRGNLVQVIEKVAPPTGRQMVYPVGGEAETLPELVDLLEGVRNARITTVEPAPVEPAGEGATAEGQG